MCNDSILMSRHLKMSFVIQYVHTVLICIIQYIIIKVIRVHYHHHHQKKMLVTGQQRLVTKSTGTIVIHLPTFFKNKVIHV